MHQHKAPRHSAIMTLNLKTLSITMKNETRNQGILKGKYHCTFDLLFDCMTIDNFCFYLQKRLIQTSQTGGQWYSDISIFPPLVFPGLFKGPITIKSNVTKDLSKIKWLYYGQYFVTYLNITIITAHTKCKVYTFVSLRF